MFPCCVFILLAVDLHAQSIRLESFIGTESPGIDVFWVKTFQEGSSFIYLSRNSLRLTNYESEQGRFSSLNVVSYQIKQSGFGLALAASASSNSAFQGRGGIQFLKAKPDTYSLYSILSLKLGSDPDARWLVIAQASPKLTETLDLFFRVEWVFFSGI